MAWGGGRACASEQQICTHRVTTAGCFGLWPACFFGGRENQVKQAPVCPVLIFFLLHTVVTVGGVCVRGTGDPSQTEEAGKGEEEFGSRGSQLQENLRWCRKRRGDPPPPDLLASVLGLSGNQAGRLAVSKGLGSTFFSGCLKSCSLLPLGQKLLTRSVFLFPSPLSRFPWPLLNPSLSRLYINIYISIFL